MNILVSLDQCRAITDWLTQMGAVSLVMPFQKRFCPIALNDTFQMDFRRLQQQLNMHQMDTSIGQNTSMLTDSAENITPPQTNIFEHNVFSPQNSPSAQHQPVPMMPTEHLGTADIVQSVNEALPATQDLEGVQNKVEIKQMNNRFWEPIENTLSKGQPAKLTVYGIPAVTTEKELTLEICRSSELFNRGQNAVKPSLNQGEKATLESKSWKYEREIQEHPFRINVVSTDPDILVSQAPRYKAVKSYITKDGQTMLTIEFGVKLEGNSEQNSDSLVVSVLRKNGIKRIFSKSFEIDTYRKSQRPTKKAKRSNGLLSSKDSNEDLDIIPSNNTNVNNAFGTTSPRAQHNIPQTPGPYAQMVQQQHSLLSPLSPPLLEVKQEFSQEQFQYMYSDGQTAANGLVRAMSTDTGEVQQVSSPSSYLLDDGGVDGGERNNVGGDIVDILLGDPGNYFDE